ncbi:hypothetical protein WAB17_10915 [Parerythrobacter aurantius]|uniref:hypothetical protein n=1 Tax=Parerythrobacter aurantius TaxID=3127706 RepID=UPI0032505DE4
MKRLPTFAAFVLAFSTPAAAQANDGIACMDRDYTAEEQVVIDGFLASADVMAESFEAQSLELVVPLAMRINACTEQQGWNEQQGDQAFLYKFAGLMMEAQGLRNPKIVELDRRIREDVPAADRDRLYRIMRETSFGEMTGEPTRQPTRVELAFLDAVLASPAVGANGEEAELLGGYIAARMVSDDAGAAFAAAGAGE